MSRSLYPALMSRSLYPAARAQVTVPQASPRSGNCISDNASVTMRSECCRPPRRAGKPVPALALADRTVLRLDAPHLEGVGLAGIHLFRRSEYVDVFPE